VRELPEGWETCKLPEVIFFQEGPGLRKYQYTEFGIPFLNIRTISNEKININLCQFLSEDEINEKYRHFLLDEGDIICSTSGTLGKTAIVQSHDLPLLLNTSVMRFRSLDEKVIIQGYIHLYLKSELFLSQAKRASTGSAQVNVGPSHLKDFDLPLPPLNEQKRIADRLDHLLTRIDKTKAHLDRIPPLLKRFRQSVLAAATSGKLTEDWREERQENCSLHSFIDADFIEADSFKDYLFPSNWEITRLQEVGDICGGVTKDSGKQDMADEELPYLRVANVQRGFLNLEEIKKIRVPEKRIEKLLLKAGDILFNEGGDIDKLGRGWIWNGEIERCTFQNHVFRARLHNPEYSPKFFSWYGNSRGYDYFLSFGKQTTNLASINRTLLAALPIVIPPIAEQQEIVRRVEALFAKADRIEAQYKSARQQVDRLTPALLAKAFRGELVPQDPNDEPAKVLLERVKEVRSATQPAKKGRVKKEKISKL
jgi:type I restriction enzyme, S subunit